MSSASDMDLGLNIKKILKNNLKIDSHIRICSAHQSCLNLLKILSEYESNIGVKVYITIAGKSNALSALVDGNSNKPVIACPPVKDVSMHDIFSSISMPSGIAPLTVLGAENAAISATKIIGLSNPNINELITEYKFNMKAKLHIQDIKCKYEINDYTLLTNKALKDCYDEENIKLSILDSTINNDLIRKGKVRDIFPIDNNSIALVASDRISAFDRNLTTIPYKGIVLHNVSNWWFNETKDLVPNHIIESYNNRTMIVNKCQVIPIEFVMRAYLTGSTSTSIWKNYEKGSRTYCGHELPDNMIKNQKLPEILLTPTTKDEHDELISEKEIIDNGILTQKQWNTCKQYAYDLFNFGQKIAKENGLILVDTKYEFGINNSGNIVLIDELHTPDSSRYWLQYSYNEQMNNSKEPESIDKEIVRKWVRENCGDPYNLENKIEIPDDIRLQLSSKYLQLYELITGKELITGELIN